MDDVLIDIADICAGLGFQHTTSPYPVLWVVFACRYDLLKYRDYRDVTGLHVFTCFDLTRVDDRGVLAGLLPEALRAPPRSVVITIRDVGKPCRDCHREFFGTYDLAAFPKSETRHFVCSAP